MPAIRRALEDRLAYVLPTGSDRARAVAVLDSLRIEHGAFDERTRSIVGIVRDVSRSATTRTALQITLSFDAAGVLRARRVEAVFTAP